MGVDYWQIRDPASYRASGYIPQLPALKQAWIIGHIVTSFQVTLECFIGFPLPTF